MDDGSKVVSFIDVGTNSIHILVVRFFGDSMGTPIFQDKETVRLGQHLFGHGFIDRETIKKTKIIMSKFVKVSKDLGAGKIIAYATCAAREASNRKELLDAINTEGLDVKVISGLEEARLIKLGVFGPDGPPQRTIEIDIGGGSTEIVLCEGKDDIFLDSLSLGSVRLAYGCGLDQNRALTFPEYDFLRRQVDMMSYRICRRVREIGFEKACGSSGTMMSLAEMCAAKRDGDSSYMMHRELSELMKELCSKDAEERKKIPGMNSGRSDIIISGGAIAEELMYLLDIDRIEISERGMKQGMEIDYLLNSGHSDFNVKDSSVLNLAKRCQYDRVHAETVRRNAILLFDDMKELGIHSMSGDMRQLLAYASVLHDVGEFISYAEHNVHSYTIILNSSIPGFDDGELETMAMLARFHHKKFPSRTSKYFKGMDSGRISNILMCAMILKIADILDRYRDSSIDLIDISVSEDTMTIGLGSESDISMEIWKLKTIKDDFKNVFGLNLEIDRI
ncbi:MAG: Ppx/GppA family phosphatase [Candidatus Methanoplasma sp.]|jgi:exopolyphosphatase/guanosine-5'-triphosphate,3'-diphosphate pyrophosphatase|nr:Ppx/GppA family phosphatase [Candidatus Methanoplasma sp.]